MFDKNELIKKSTPKALPVRSRSLLVPLTKLGLHLRLALVKCSGLVRTKFKLRLWLAFTKCSTQKRLLQLQKPLAISTLILFVYHFFTFCCSRKSSATLLPKFSG